MLTSPAFICCTHDAPKRKHDNYLGYFAALTIFLLWCSSWGLLLPQSSSLAVLAPGLLIRSFAQTGLFILAHDAMHGSLCPGQPGLNRRLGQVCLWAYGLLPFERCCRNHMRHHCATGSNIDPDAPPAWIGRQCHQGLAIAAWYLKFISNYCSISQLTALISCWGLAIGFLYSCFAVPLVQSAMVLVLPLLFSSWQLFFFGTYQPHRNLLGQIPIHLQSDWDLTLPKSSLNEQFISPLKQLPCSSSFPVGLAFLACYYFSYHREHHSNPNLPWYRLPKAHIQILSGTIL